MRSPPFVHGLVKSVILMAVNDNVAGAAGEALIQIG
jgi:hypothetical protein